MDEIDSSGQVISTHKTPGRKPGQKSRPYDPNKLTREARRNALIKLKGRSDYTPGNAAAVPTPPTVPARFSDIPPTAQEQIQSSVSAGGDAYTRITATIGKARVSTSHFIGLSKPQRIFLLNRALTETDDEARKLSGITPAMLSKWRRNDTFMRAYGALWVDPSSFTMQMIDNLLPKTVEVLEDVLHGGKNSDKLKAIALIMGSKGILKPDSGESTENEYERRLAKLLDERGVAMPNKMRELTTPIEGEYTIQELES